LGKTTADRRVQEGGKRDKNTVLSRLYKGGFGRVGVLAYPLGGDGSGRGRLAGKAEKRKVAGKGEWGMCQGIRKPLLRDSMLVPAAMRATREFPEGGEKRRLGRREDIGDSKKRERKKDVYKYSSSGLRSWGKNVSYEGRIMLMVDMGQNSEGGSI